MGWSYPDISLEEVLKLLKGFVDILILASGYQSTGLHAHWDALTIKKAFQWGLFFENLFRLLSSSDDYKDSVKELDATLLEMTSNAHFPQGLAHLSSVTLSRAREFVLAHMLQTLPLRDAHLRAILTAAIDADLDELQATETACLDVYHNKLRQQNISLLQNQDRRGFNISITSSSNNYPDTKLGSCTNDNLTKCTVQELLKRQFSVFCLLSADSGLEVLSKTIRQSNLTESDNILEVEQLKHATDSLNKEQSVEYLIWTHWRSKSLSYMMHKRTIRLVSGASMIFSAPKIQWVQMFEQLNILAEINDDVVETIELLLLGCISSRWICLLDHCMSVSYESLTISKQYHELCNLLLRRSQNRHAKEEAMDSNECGILEYLTALLGRQLHLLWKLSPFLAAIAIPSWSPLFKAYLSEIENQFKGDPSKIRCCTCIRDEEEHRECELAERIWCLYIFHIRGSHVMRR